MANKNFKSAVRLIDNITPDIENNIPIDLKPYNFYGYYKWHVVCDGLLTGVVGQSNIYLIGKDGETIKSFSLSSEYWISGLQFIYNYSTKEFKYRGGMENNKIPEYSTINDVYSIKVERYSGDNPTRAYLFYIGNINVTEYN